MKTMNTAAGLAQDKQAANGVYASFLMIGQSNMAGRGHFNEIEPVSDPRCKMLRMGRWQPMSEPVNPDRQIFNPSWHSGISLGPTFAIDAADYYNAKVGLIPCADGGTALREWMPGTTLFDHAVMMSSLAGRTSTLHGILWHQGESDCMTFDEEYERNIAVMFRELRKALDDANLPAVIGELSGNINCTGLDIEKVKAFNRRLPAMAAQIGNCAVAKAEDLAVQGDGIHFSAVSQRTLGHRYFEAFRSLV